MTGSATAITAVLIGSCFLGVSNAAMLTGDGPDHEVGWRTACSILSMCADTSHGRILRRGGPCALLRPSRRSRNLREEGLRKMGPRLFVAGSARGLQEAEAV